MLRLAQGIDLLATINPAILGDTISTLINPGLDICVQALAGMKIR
jgi:hypothetical protein